MNEIGHVVSRTSEVERRMRDLESRMTELEGVRGLGGLRDEIDRAQKARAVKGISTGIGGGNEGGIFGWDPPPWDPRWNPPQGGLEPSPDDGGSDQGVNGPWGPGNPPDGIGVRFHKYMHDKDTGAYLGSFPVTLVYGQSQGTVLTSEAGVHGRAVFHVVNGETYTVTWPAINGYESGNEQVTIHASPGGVHTKTNEVSRVGNTWPPEWKPPQGWDGNDPFPPNDWTDDDKQGPWGTDPPPQSQAVRLSKYMVDATTQAPLPDVPVTLHGGAGGLGSTSINTDANGRAAFRVRQGGFYTLSWPSINGHNGGEESFTVSANAGGVDKKTNQVAKNQAYPSIFAPDPDWHAPDHPADIDTMPDDNQAGPWGADPPIAGQAVLLSKYFKDANTGASLGSIPVTVAGPGASVSGTSDDTTGRYRARVKQGATYTVSWQAHGNYGNGTEQVAISAAAGGVHVKTNNLTPLTLDQAATLAKTMHGNSGSAIVSMPITLSGPGNPPAANTDASGVASFPVNTGRQYTLTWPALNGYASGSESITITVGPGGTQQVTNNLSTDPQQGGTGWAPRWVPPPDWSGVDVPTGTSEIETPSDDGTEGPWGNQPPPAGQAVIFSKYFKDATSGALLGSIPVTVSGGGGSVSGTTGTTSGRYRSRVRQGGSYTVSWGAHGNYAAGSEQVTISANAGGVHKMVNEISQSGNSWYMVHVYDSRWQYNVSGANVSSSGGSGVTNNVGLVGDETWRANLNSTVSITVESGAPCPAFVNSHYTEGKTVSFQLTFDGRTFQVDMNGVPYIIE